MPLLWNKLRGYVIIEVEGRFPERFLNMCSKNNIVLWNVIRRSEKSFSAGLHLRDAKKLRRVARRTCCHVHFAQKKGLPFVIKRLLSHKLFIVGMIACMLILTILNFFVWKVNIICDQPFDRSQVEQILGKNDVKPGVLASKLDLEQCQVEILKECKYIAWAYIKRNGMVINVNLALAKEAPEVVSIDQPSNIVAERSGVIESIHALKGEKVVVPGKIVRKGDILITGELKSLIENNPPDYVHAMGNVRATTWYEKAVIIEKTGAGDTSDLNAAVLTAEGQLKNIISKDAVIKSTKVRVYSNQKGQRFAKVTVLCIEDIGKEVRLEGKVCTR